MKMKIKWASIRYKRLKLSEQNSVKMKNELNVCNIQNFFFHFSHPVFQILFHFHPVIHVLMISCFHVLMFHVL